ICAIFTFATLAKYEDDIQHNLACGDELSANIGAISYKVDVPVAQNDGINGSNEYVNKTSKHYVVNSIEGHLRHPPMLKSNDLEANCQDYLDIFKFHPATAWTRSQRACNETSFEKWESDDMIMVVFISDATNTGRDSI
ncbi:hypothetical protein Ocin01_19819, partial [Orchesella cincta]